MKRISKLLITTLMTLFSFSAMPIYTTAATDTPVAPTNSPTAEFNLTLRYTYELPSKMYLKNAAYSQTGAAYLTAANSKDNVYLIAIDNKGEKRWSFLLGKTVETNLFTDEQDNVYYSYSQWDSDITYVVKRNKRGQIVWNKKYNYTIVLQKVGNYIVIQKPTATHYLDLKGNEIEKLPGDMKAAYSYSDNNLDYSINFDPSTHRIIFSSYEKTNVKTDGTNFSSLVASKNLKYLAGYSIYQEQDAIPNVYLYNKKGKLILKKPLANEKEAVENILVTDSGSIVYTTNTDKLVVVDQKGNIRANVQLESLKYQPDDKIRLDENNHLHYLDQVYSLQGEKIADFDIDASYYYTKPKGNLFAYKIGDDGTTQISRYTINN